MIALVIGAFIVPTAWLEPIQTILGEAPKEDPFTLNVSTLDSDLESGRSRVWLGTLEPIRAEIQVRRLLRAGPMSSKEMAEASEILRQSRSRILSQTSPGSRDAERKFRNEKLAKTFPRLDANKIGPALDQFDQQVDATVPKRDPAGLPCADCHIDLLSVETEVDVSGLWPLIPPEDIGGGKAIPLMMDSLDLPAYSLDLGAGKESSNCIDCHSNHSAPDFVITKSDRQTNMGFWLESYRVEDLVYVQTKIRNNDTPHRVPGGHISRAYVVLVEVHEGHDRQGRRLPQYFGARLPDHLQQDGKQAGTMFWREMVDSDGKPTSNPQRAFDVLDDTRLLGQRFIAHRFLFELPEASGQTPYYVMARLIYLPDFMSWDGAIDVEVRVDQTH